MKKSDQSKNFTVVDFLLNEGEWDLCHGILVLWRQSLDMSKKTDVDGDDLGNPESDSV